MQVGAAGPKFDTKQPEKNLQSLVFSRDLTFAIECTTLFHFSAVQIIEEFDLSRFQISRFAVFILSYQKLPNLSVLVMLVIDFPCFLGWRKLGEIGPKSSFSLLLFAFMMKTVLASDRRCCACANRKSFHNSQDLRDSPTFTPFSLHHCSESRVIAVQSLFLSLMNQESFFIVLVELPLSVI